VRTEDLTGSLAPVKVACSRNRFVRSLEPDPVGVVRFEEFGESDVRLELGVHRPNRHRARHMVRTCRFHSVATTEVLQRIAECHRVLSPSHRFVGNGLEACAMAHVLG